MSIFDHQPLYDSCTEPAYCKPCDKFLGFWVSKDNARRALQTHNKSAVCVAEAKPKPVKATKPKPRVLKAKPTYTARCLCGWMSKPAPNKIDTLAQHAGHLISQPSCMPRAMDMELIKNNE